MLGCRGVRHDPKGIWPNLLTTANNKLLMYAARPEISYYTWDLKGAVGGCWSYSGQDGGNAVSARPRRASTTDYKRE